MAAVVLVLPLAAASWFLKSNIMEINVIGCIDCPLFDETGSEYGTYCHHPNAKTIQRLYSSGRSVDLPFQLADGLYRNETDAGTYSVSVKTDNAEIKDDENQNPITPKWCPLNTEPITITKNQ